MNSITFHMDTSYLNQIDVIKHNYLYNISIYQDNLIQSISQYIYYFLRDKKNGIFIGYNNKSTHFKPEIHIDYGSYELSYKDTILYIHYNVIGKPQAKSTELDIFKYMVLSHPDNMEILEDFLSHAREYEKQKEMNKVICYMMTHGVWRILSKQDKRELDTIYLEEKVKVDFITDIQYFLDNPELYEQFGIPYKRNYLLEGIPGTGKTSLILAVASYFNMNIGIVSLNKDLDDFTFMKSISNIPDDTILVLEDVDSLFDEDRENCLSFSGLLNTLDGLARQRKLIIFMTTNYVDKLNTSLKRAGRVDYEIHFDYCDSTQIKIILGRFFPNLNSTIILRFLEKIQNLKITPAMLQTYFQKIMFHNLKDNMKILDEIHMLEKISMEFMKDYQSSLYL